MTDEERAVLTAAMGAARSALGVVDRQIEVIESQLAATREHRSTLASRIQKIEDALLKDAMVQ